MPHGFRDWRRDPVVRMLKPLGPPATRQQSRLIMQYAAELGVNCDPPVTEEEAGLLLADLVGRRNRKIARDSR
jgi:hypothetical protein